MEKSTKICIAYCGPSVDNGSMDAKTLGEVLISMSSLVNQANRLLNNDNSSIDVRVKADFQKGSFEIVLALIQTLPEPGVESSNPSRRTRISPIISDKIK